MLTDYTLRFYFALTIGLAVGLIGLVNVLAPRVRWPGRICLTVTAAALPIAGLTQLQDEPGMTLAAAGLVAALVLTSAVAGSKPVVAVAKRSGTRWAVLGVVGFLAAVGSGVWYDWALERDAEEKMRDLEVSETQLPLEVVTATVVTDRGLAVEVKRPKEIHSAAGSTDADESRLRARQLLLSVIRLSPADDTSNCHGWVFAGGKYWIGGLQVDPILADNGYYHVLAPAVGDLIVYRDPSGAVTHSAVVRAIPDGLPPLVESKWGALGVFLHPIDKSPYGTDFTCYRSPRTGHVLAGLSTPATPGKVVLP